jgi:hypothetical protein
MARTRRSLSTERQIVSPERQRARIEKRGVPAKLRMTPERGTLCAGGGDGAIAGFKERPAARNQKPKRYADRKYSKQHTDPKE